MRNHWKTCSSLLAGGALAMSACMALPENSALAAPGAKPGAKGPMGRMGGGPGGRMGGGRMRPDRYKMMVDKLKLTPAQQKKIKPIIDRDMKAMQAMRADTKMPRDQKMTKYRAMREKSRKEIDAILTPAQRATRNKMDAERRAQWGKGGGGGMGGGGWGGQHRGKGGGMGGER